MIRRDRTARLIERATAAAAEQEARRRRCSTRSCGSSCSRVWLRASVASRSVRPGQHTNCIGRIYRPVTWTSPRTQALLVAWTPWKTSRFRLLDEVYPAFPALTAELPDCFRLDELAGQSNFTLCAMV